MKPNKVQVIVFGFLLMILTGAILLWLPISSSDGSFTSPADALFTATTSVCVTGLTTVTMATHWSLFGKLVILALIQLGGLGVVCAGIGLMVLVKKKITIRERLLIQTAYNLDNIDGMVRLIRNVSLGAFAAEGVGAVFYAFVFIPDYGVIKGIWYSIFHAVSAFCNAGIDLLGDSSLCMYRDNVPVNVTTMLLIVTGGIGFIVWWDIKKVVAGCIRLKSIRGNLFKRLTVHSKIAIVTTLVCIGAGTLILLMAEYDNPATIGELDFGHKLLSGLFQSVTTRTAGFATIPQQNFREISYVCILLLMLIGGSPMGTAGGIKTTGVAILFFCVKSTVKGRKDTEAFHRRIGNDNVRNAIAVIFIAVSFILCAVLILAAIEQAGLQDMTFEVVSAISTAGLTRGITGSLSVAGKCILCLVMFAGRIGPITLVMALNIKRKKQNMSNIKELAETRILIG